MQPLGVAKWRSTAGHTRVGHNLLDWKDLWRGFSYQRRCIATKFFGNKDLHKTAGLDGSAERADWQWSLFQETNRFGGLILTVVVTASTLGACLGCLEGARDQWPGDSSDRRNES